MRHSRRFLALLSVTAFLLTSSTLISAQAAPVKAGSSCSTLKTRVVSNFVRYECVKSGSKKVWKKIGTVKTPTATPTLTPSSTEASTVDQVGIDVTNCKLQQASSRNDVYSGWNRNPDRTQSVGKVRYAVLFVDFSDKVSGELPEVTHSRISPKTEQEFLEQSSGKFELEFVPLLKWLRMPSPASAYSFKTFDSHRSYIAEAVNLADPAFDFSKMDGVLVMTDPNNAPISYGPALTARRGSGVIADGKELLNGATSGTDLRFWGSRWANHEMSHNLGLADLYSYAGDTHRFVGPFSYMGLINKRAAGLTAWERWTLDWVTDGQVACEPNVGQAVKLNPLSGSGTRIMIVKISSHKALAIEVRTPFGIDAGLTRSGILAYTVDTRIASGEGTIAVLPKTSLNLDAPELAFWTAGDEISAEGRTVAIVSNSGNDYVVKVVK